VTKLTAIAVAKKVAVATKLAGDSIELPLRPLPEVHPPAGQLLSEEGSQRGRLWSP
jgi:hypothetical protein